MTTHIEQTPSTSRLADDPGYQALWALRIGFTARTEQRRSVDQRNGSDAAAHLERFERFRIQTRHGYAAW